jgi:ribonucleoside-diphosphate reductase alpha chain
MTAPLTITKRNGTREPFDMAHVRRALQFATDGLPIDPVELEAEAAIAWHDGIAVDEIQASLIRTALQHLDPDHPDWDRVAARLVRYDIYNRAQAARHLVAPGYGQYPALVHQFVAAGVYTDRLPATYSDADLSIAETWIDPARDARFRYAGLQLLLDRYVVHHPTLPLVELPQELFLSLALTLAIPEAPAVRLSYARAFYDALSQLDVTMATPTFANARRPHGQLSSCFVDTVPDSLEGIYHSLSTFARVSKSGGGLGSYLGHVRAERSAIQGVPGVAKGVLPWMRLYNDTAVAVDQLGQRSGAVTLWLDIWHPDVLDFIEARTPQGDERRKARDIFPGLCIPDAFMRAVQADDAWHCFDPHTVEQTLGFRLEDVYGDAWDARYAQCVAHPDLPRTTIPAKTLWRAVLQAIHRSGTPFLFFRDTVNRTNPNAHAGMVYSSNLCTEVIQNQSPSEPAPPVSTADDQVLQTITPGDLVVCNLASIHLGHMHTPADIDRTVPLVVRMLDNVITLNHLPVPQATRTNTRYRAIGLGVHGYQQYLVQHGIAWESEAHIQEADALFERIAYRALDASADLAEERGAYPLFPGSGWATGHIFAQRGYTSDAWQALQARIQRTGLRNGYLLAIAPTGSTSILADATPGIDPVFDHIWREDKQGFAVSRIAPGMTPDTRQAFNTAHHTDQTWSIRAAAARQRHLDQGQSLNLYRTPTMDARQLSAWYQLAWETGVKTVYYFRNFRPDAPLVDPSPTTPAVSTHPTPTDTAPTATAPTIVCLGCEL